MAIFFQNLGKSVGEILQKIYILTDGNKFPLKIHITKGKTYDSVPAKNLLKNLITDYLISDKSHDLFNIIDLYRIKV